MKSTIWPSATSGSAAVTYHYSHGQNVVTNGVNMTWLFMKN